MNTPESYYASMVRDLAESEVEAVVAERVRDGKVTWNGRSRRAAVLAVMVRIDPCDDEAATDLIASQAGVVRDECRRWSPIMERTAYHAYSGDRRAYSWSDLKNAAAIGLLQGAHAYDPRRGSFGSTAKVCVQRAIQRYGINLLDQLRLPQANAGGFKDPTVAVARAKAKATKFCSLVDWRDAATAVPESRWGFEDVNDRDHVALVLWRAVESLDPRTASVVAMRIGRDDDPMLLSEIGKVIGVTRERTRQIYEQGLATLAKRLREDDFS